MSSDHPVEADEHAVGLRTVVADPPEASPARDRARPSAGRWSLLPRAPQAVRTSMRRVLPRRLLGFWARSLPTRVVVTTLVGSLTVLLLSGIVLTLVASRLVVGSKEASSRALAETSLRNAQAALDVTQLDASTTGDATLSQLTEALVAQGNDGLLFDVVRIRHGSPGNNLPVTGALPQSLPAALRTAVQTEEGIWASPMSIDYGAGHTAPGYAVGSRLLLPDNTSAELYLVFPLTEERNTLIALRYGVLIAGLLLAALLTLIAFLVSRQTVSPVRAARVTAQSIAAGNLDDRMQVQGTDDFASLAVAMNGMAEELQRQIVQLEELSRMQQRFVSDVSHELRTPLTTVRMASELIHDTRDTLEPVVARSAELLQGELDRFESLLTDLLEISRFDAGAAVLSLEPVDLSAVGRRTVGAYAGFAASKGIEITVDAPPETVTGDARRIERIVRNLVSNAIEHGEGRPVQIRVVGNDQAVSISVRDHGVGFAADQADLVFHRFWRADPSRARTIGGTGLGLAIAAEDAKLHGGTLRAWGEPGAGAQFTLTLPRQGRRPFDTAPIDPVPVRSTPFEAEHDLDGVGDLR